MANYEQLDILKQGGWVWNHWLASNRGVAINLSGAILWGVDLSLAYLSKADLSKAILSRVNLRGANLSQANLTSSNLQEADLTEADLSEANLRQAELTKANLSKADLVQADFNGAYLRKTNLMESNLRGADLSRVADLTGSIFSQAEMDGTSFGNLDLTKAIGLEDVNHSGPSSISTDTFAQSKGRIPEVFLRGCGLSDWEIEEVKLYDPDLSNDDVNKILYKMYDLRASQAIQISPLFISYSHADSSFVDKVEVHLDGKGIRFWRDVHDATAGRLEKQIDQAIRQNPTVLLVLSKHSLNSDWVEHEVRTARELEKEMGRDVLCPVALDDSWKSSRWPKRVMEQMLEYNILDFSAWQDDSKFDDMFRKLIDGLQLFYKG